MKTIHFHTSRGCLSYITYDEATREAALIDPSEEIKTDEYIKALEDNSLSLVYILETHTHADHVSSSESIKTITNAKVARSEMAPSRKADIYLKDADILRLGESEIKVLYTPGHTNESLSFYNGVEVFTGDTLLIGGTGRTDFQIGSSENLYDSLHDKIADLPNETLIRPGHDYNGRNKARLSDELHTNERFNLCRESFINKMNNHHPQKPELFDESISKNSL